MSEMLYGQQHLHNSSSSFIFMLTGQDGNSLFGVCVSKDEPVEVREYFPWSLEYLPAF